MQASRDPLGEAGAKEKGQGAGRAGKPRFARLWRAKSGSPSADRTICGQGGVNPDETAGRSGRAKKKAEQKLGPSPTGRYEVGKRYSITGFDVAFMAGADSYQV
jgi:hypothetical protein